MKKEITMRGGELQDKTLRSLYFGGGTPSVLSSDEIKSLLDQILQHHNFAPDIEITLEANPDDLDSAFVKGLRSAGINRLSIGIQSFHDADLKFMNRAHNAAQAEDSIKRVQDSGIENISIDLIYGSPVSDTDIWKQNLEKTAALQVPHISSYALTVEPKTALSAWISQNKIQQPSESEQNLEFHLMCDFLKGIGFDHYEISNFARPGFYSQHNSAYWKYSPYLGIGPSAHSYDGSDRRSWNLANNILYIRELEAGRLPSESEHLSAKDRFNEMVMTGLRTSRGVDLRKLQQLCGDDLMEHLKHESRSKLEDGLLILAENHMKIPEKHWFLADGIASDLFKL